MRFSESVLAGASWLGVVLIQVTLVMMLGLLAWLVVIRAGPVLRGAVLLATLLALLLLPALAVLAPTWLPLPECVCPASPAPIPASQGNARRPTPGRPAAAIQGGGGTFKVAVMPDGKTLAVVGDKGVQLWDLATGKELDQAGQQMAKIEAIFELSGPAEEAAPPEPAREPAGPSWSLAAVLSAVWLLGAVVCLTRSLLQLAALYRCSWRARPIREQDWVDCVAALARRDGLPAILLRESAAITSPLTLGLFQQVVLLPPGWRTWSACERALILEHELAHIRRHDFLAGLTAELVACLCWFHPLVRWAAARLRMEQEFAADAWVAVTHNVRDYVRCLARLALEQSQGRGSLAPALWRRRPEILRRIDMLQHAPKGLPTRLSKRAGWAVTALAAAACLIVAGVGPLRSAAEDAKKAESASEKAAKDTDPHGDALPAGALARLGTTRLRHGGDVTFVAFVDGKRLLTAGKDGTIRLWDLEKRQEVRRFAKPKAVAPEKPGPVDKAKVQRNAFEAMVQARAQGGGSFRVALSPDGKTLAAAGDNVVQLWDLETGKELRKVEGTPAELTGLLFSPDGKTLAGRRSNGSLFLWAVASGKKLHHLQPAQRKGPRNLVFAIGGGEGPPAPGMTFTPDSKHLVAVVTDFVKEEAVRSIKFHEVTSGKETRKIDIPKGINVSALAITSDGKRLAYALADKIRLCAADTGKPIRHFSVSNNVQSLVFSPDGKTLAARETNKRVRLWATDTGKELHQLHEAEPSRQTGGLFIFGTGITGPEVRALAISADGKQVASAAGPTVRLWETATGKEVNLIDGHWRTPSAIVLSADGKHVVTWGADRVVRRWDAVTGKLLNAFPAAEVAAFSPDGLTVALASADKTIRLHDTATGKELRTFAGSPNGTTALTFAPGGKVLASRGRGDNTIRLHNVASGVEMRQLAIGPKNAPARDGFVIVFGGGGRSTSRTGPGLIFSPDGKLLAAPVTGNDYSNAIVFFDVATNKELRKIQSSQPILSFAFSPDGRTIATEHAGQTVTLWEVASAKECGKLGKALVAQPQGNPGQMAVRVAGVNFTNAGSDPGGPAGISFSPDGRALAVRGADLSVRLLDVTTGKEIGRFKGHGGGIQTISFGPNGKTLASGSSDTTVLVWDVAEAMKNLAKPASVELTGAEVESLWGDLAGEDAIKARQGVHKLAAAKQSMPFLGKHLKPAARVEAKKISGWLNDLDSDKFRVRQEATAHLVKAGEQVVPALLKLLASGPPLETRKRAEELVDRLTSGTMSTEQLRLIRAVEVLERMGTPEAKRVLQSLAGGAPGTLPTREAQAALDRLAATRS